MSLGEMFLSPTSMLYRNLAAMEVEELLRAQPLDAVVLLGGCDKTLPALLMGACSADVPHVGAPRMRKSGSRPTPVTPAPASRPGAR